jgi:hypothetical protein
MAEQTKQIPIAALKFAADLEMGDNGDGAKTVPIKVKARGARSVDHWYFGRMVTTWPACRSASRAWRSTTATGKTR